MRKVELTALGLSALLAVSLTGLSYANQTVQSSGENMQNMQNGNTSTNGNSRRNRNNNQNSNSNSNSNSNTNSNTTSPNTNGTPRP